MAPKRKKHPRIYQRWMDGWMGRWTGESGIA